MSNQEDFWLYDLEVETVLEGRTPVCRHIEGEKFRVEGENLIFPEHQKISMYALAAILPLLTAKQRETAPHDWMTTDAEIACPDPLEIEPKVFPQLILRFHNGQPCQKC